MNNTKVYELEVKVFLTKDMNCNESHEYIAETIDKSLSRDGEHLEFHKENKFKYYCFNNLYPMEKDYLFKKGNIYTFRLRTVDHKLADYFNKVLINEYTSNMKILSIDNKVIPNNHLDKIITITPLVMKFEEGYWRGKEKVSTVEKRIKNNLIKKYNSYYNTNISEDFELFLTFSFKNQKPIPSKYKNITLLGDKIEFKVSNSPMAQELFYFALGTGVGELNSRGFGFINYLWLPKVS